MGSRGSSVFNSAEDFFILCTHTNSPTSKFKFRQEVESTATTATQVLETLVAQGFERVAVLKSTATRFEEILLNQSHKHCGIALLIQE